MGFTIATTPHPKTDITDREMTPEDASELLEFWYQGMRARMEMEVVFGAGLVSETNPRSLDIK